MEIISAKNAKRLSEASSKDIEIEQLNVLILMTSLQKKLSLNTYKTDWSRESIDMLRINDYDVAIKPSYITISWKEAQI